MSVYKEGYHALELIEKNSKQIWQDACDFGAPTKEGDEVWNWTKQLVEWYGIPSTRKSTVYSKQNAEVSIIVSLIDEWAVCDEIKTIEQATEFYKITYFKHSIINADGFFTAERVVNKEEIKAYKKAENDKINAAA